MRRISANCSIPIFAIRHRQKYNCINKCRIMLGIFYLQIISIILFYFVSNNINIYSSKIATNVRYPANRLSWQIYNFFFSFYCIYKINIHPSKWLYFLLYLLFVWFVAWRKLVGVFYCWYFVFMYVLVGECIHFFLVGIWKNPWELLSLRSVTVKTRKHSLV